MAKRDTSKSDRDTEDLAAEESSGSLRRRDVLKSAGAVALGASTGVAGLTAVPNSSVSKVRASSGGSAIIDDFEDASLSEYQLFRDENGPAFVSSPSYSGSTALAIEGTSTELLSTSGLEYYPSSGDTFSVLTRWDGPANAVALNYGVQDYDNRYHMVLSPDSGSLRLLREEQGSITAIAKDFFDESSTVEDTWYELEVDWQDDGTHVCSIYDEKETQIAQVSVVDDTWSSGGIGYRGMEVNTGATDYFDFAAEVGAIPDRNYELQDSRAYILDDFRDGELSEYDLYREKNGPAVVSSPTHHGSSALAIQGTSTELLSTAGLGGYPAAGSIISTWTRWEPGANAVSLCYGVQDESNRYYADLSPDGEYIRILREENGSVTKIAAQWGGFTTSADTWYQLEVKWSRDGAHTFTVYAEDGTEVAKASTVDSTWSSGGIGYRGMEANTGATDYFDYTTVRQTALPNVVSITGKTSSTVDYEFAATGEIQTVAESTTSTSVSNVVGDGDTDTYDFSGEVSRIEDDNVRLDVDYGNAQLTVTDLSGSSPQYELSVTGSLTATDSDNSATVSDGTATGSVTGGSDTYDFTGDVIQFKHVSMIEFELQITYPRILDNPYPDASVSELSIEYVSAPNSDRIAFTSSAIEEGYNLYLADGVSSPDKVPNKIRRVDVGSEVGTADLRWPDPDQLQFWRDGLISTQRLTSGNVQRETPQEASAAPEPTQDGGVN